MIIKHYDTESMIEELKGDCKEVRIQAVTARKSTNGAIHNSYEIIISAQKNTENPHLHHEYRERIALELQGETKRNYNARKRAADAEQQYISKFKKAGFKVLKGVYVGKDE